MYKFECELPLHSFYLLKLYITSGSMTTIIIINVHTIFIKLGTINHYEIVTITP